MSMKKTKATRVKKRTLAQVKKDTWKIVSLAIRLRDCNVHGQVECISCNTVAYYIKDNIHAGHFFQSRNFSGVRWDLNNIHGQCAKCNIGLAGNQYRYSVKLRQKIGEKSIELLNTKADEKFKETVVFLDELKQKCINIILQESKDKNLYDWKQMFTKKEVESWHVSEI
jgi:hypothetical protein